MFAFQLIHCVVCANDCAILSFLIELVVHQNDCAMCLFQLVYRVVYRIYCAMFGTIEETVCLTVTWIIFMEVGNIIMLFIDYFSNKSLA